MTAAFDLPGSIDDHVDDPAHVFVRGTAHLLTENALYVLPIENRHRRFLRPRSVEAPRRRATARSGPARSGNSRLRGRRRHRQNAASTIVGAARNKARIWPPDTLHVYAHKSGVRILFLPEIETRFANRLLACHQPPDNSRVMASPQRDTLPHRSKPQLCRVGLISYRAFGNEVLRSRAYVGNGFVMRPVLVVTRLVGKRNRAATPPAAAGTLKMKNTLLLSTAVVRASVGFASAQNAPGNSHGAAANQGAAQQSESVP